MYNRLSHRGWLTGLFTAWLLLTPMLALAQGTPRLQVQSENRQIFAEMPFILQLIATGFEETPQPEPPELNVPGAEVTFVGVNPQVRSMVQIINGVRSESRDVTFVYNYRVVVPRRGNYTVAAATLTQGTRTATSQAANFTATVIGSTADMKIKLELPQRTLWIGETFEAHIDLLLLKSPNNPSFTIPLFERGDLFTVKAPPIDPRERRQLLPVPTAAGEIKLPFEQSPVTLGGKQYTRLRFTAFLTAKKAGAFKIAPAQVFAELVVGAARDNFGFRRNRTQPFKATDVPRQITIKPLPANGRPSSYRNAFGDGFSIKVQADRTVVSVGDPVELTLTIRGSGNLDGLILPSLEDAGLDRRRFSLPSTAPIGEDVRDAQDVLVGKRFKVSIRLRSDRVSEIPPLAFSYFDGTSGQYKTVRSEPIALSVKGANMISAQDVVSGNTRPTPSATPQGSSPSGGAPQAAGRGMSLVGAELGLSDPSKTLATVLQFNQAIPWLMVLYLLPLFILGVLMYRQRTAGDRAQRDAVRDCRREVDAAIDRAATLPAREAAAPLGEALRKLARILDISANDDGSFFQRLDNEAFNPRAASEPLPANLRNDARALAKRWSEQRPEKNSAQHIALLLLMGSSLMTPAFAEATSIDEARGMYQQALAEANPARRVATFRRAEVMYRELASEHPHSPDLLTDWGNAALGAQDLGTATLAYRRALHLDPTHERATLNLTWTRGTMPDWLPKPDDRSAVNSFLFWNRHLSSASTALLGALFFALMILMIAPWPFTHRFQRLLRGFAIIPGVFWLWLSAAAILADDARDQAVLIQDGEPLRSADSLGAATVTTEGLPAGAEVTILESRNEWVHVSLADGGQSGWVSVNAIGRVVP